MENSSSVCVDRLPVRVHPLPDEWTETLLGRKAREFGVRRPWRGELDRLRPFLPLHLRSETPGTLSYGGERLPGWAAQGRGAQIRYCCVCMQERRYIRARWRLSQFTVCTSHSVVLKAGLVEPAITSNYKHPDRHLVDEITEQEMWDGSHCATPVGLAYAKTIWEVFELAAITDAPNDQIAEALAWALLAERLLDAVVTSIRGPDYPQDGVLRHEHRADWLQRHSLQVAPNREGISQFLRSLPQAAHRRSAIACLSRLINDEARTTTVMSRLPLQLLKDLLLGASLMSAGISFGALPRALHPEAHKSFEATEAVLRCSSGLLYFLIREHVLRGVKKVPFGRKTYVFIPNEEVKDCRLFLSTCMPFDELLANLQIDRSGYRTLHDAGLIEPIELGSWRLYRKAQVNGLMSRLNDVARPALPDQANLLPLMGSWLHSRYRPRSLIRQVFADILAGRVAVYRCLDSTGLKSYWVDHHAPARLHWLSNAHYATVLKERTMPSQLALWEAA